MSNCISCGRYLPEGYGWVCTDCLRKTEASIMAIDPGESIGIVARSSEKVYGMTITGEFRLRYLWNLLLDKKPKTVVFEEFALRQSAAKQLIGSKFITCEVVGVIKLYAQLSGCLLVPLIPANKEFCGFSSSARDPHFQGITMVGGEKITEHTRDAYRLLRYAELFKLKEKQDDR